MQLQKLGEILQGNAYPGRGIVLGRSPSGDKAAIAYFIMGRSENSRNRVFVAEGESLRTQAFDPAKLVDPSLVIYFPLRVLDDKVIVTNGDQTDTVYEALKTGETFEDALRARTFEPDPPIYTPRISGLLELGESLSYRLSILKSAGGNPDSVRRYFYEYTSVLPGQGHFIHTYLCDGDPVPSFAGEPVAVEIPENMNNFAREVWEGLDNDNKVALFVRYIDLTTGNSETAIFNKLEGQ